MNKLTGLLLFMIDVALTFENLCIIQRSALSWVRLLIEGGVKCLLIFLLLRAATFIRERRLIE